jgi:hypothetical protein
VSIRAFSRESAALAAVKMNYRLFWSGSWLVTFCGNIMILSDHAFDHALL